MVDQIQISFRTYIMFMYIGIVYVSYVHSKRDFFSARLLSVILLRDENPFSRVPNPKPSTLVANTAAQFFKTSSLF